MRRIMLTVAYDGTNYCGWQFQPNGVTIEEIFNRTLSELLKEPVCIIGASRTDAGVHALGNVAVFDTESRIPADKLLFAINQGLPEDIRVVASKEVAPDWHPRKQNSVKTYEYRILNSRVAIPTRRLYAYFCYYPLNVEKMREAAAYLVGEHDFSSFCSARHQAKETVRTLYSVCVERDADDLITIRLRGNGFLYNMVRIIAGTLMKVGLGIYPPGHVQEILEARDRQMAGQTAPAKGLTLVGIEYEREPQDEIAGENRHWSYVLDQRELKNGRSVLTVNFCEEAELPRLLRRMAHQAYRNGAKEILIRLPASCNVSETERYGLYRLERAGELWRAVYAGGEAAAKRGEDEETTLLFT
ncbi:MAG: tRNA pseudouridine(38-40) synthase TruA [Lachnospiraceae bacterium]|jgi:tRNA pseudouridine38-40 synthase|nr:tRNA pseudouridine(38-40) synthase TruA [Lachnospiraceae bacterium]